MNLIDKKIAIIGLGFMGSAIVEGIATRSDLNLNNIIGADVDSCKSRERLTKDKINITVISDNSKAASAADIILLAVKPNVVKGVLSEIKEKVDEKKLIISIAAGINIKDIASSLPNTAKIVRAMPNVAATIGQSISGLSRGANVTDRDFQIAVDLFSLIGSTLQVDEKMLDAVTAISGAGPAYLFLFLESLIDAGVLLGLTRDESTLLAKKMTLGAVMLADQSASHISQLKEMVTSPAGATIAGLQELEECKFKAAILKATATAANRSKELGKLR
ncbi:MAG: pyrroline-5-carboxylate reductase [Nitrospinota bacterium]